MCTFTLFKLRYTYIRYNPDTSIFFGQILYVTEPTYEILYEDTGRQWNFVEKKLVCGFNETCLREWLLR